MGQTGASSCEILSLACNSISRSRMAALGLRGTKILGVRDTTLRARLSVPKGTQNARYVRAGGTCLWHLARTVAGRRKRYEVRTCAPELRGGEAGQEGAEEGVRGGVEADLGVGGIGGTGWNRFGAGETLFVNADVHGLDGAKGGVDEE